MDHLNVAVDAEGSVLQAVVLRFLVLGVFPDHGFVMPYVGDENPAKALANEMSFPLSVHASDVDGLPLPLQAVGIGASQHQKRRLADIISHPQISFVI